MKKELHLWSRIKPYLVNDEKTGVLETVKKSHEEKKDRKKHPELFYEVNIVDPESTMITVDYVYSKNRLYTNVLDPSDKTKYKLVSKGMSFQNTKKGYISSFVFVRGNPDPYDFTNMNKGVPSRVVKLLYKPDTYRILISPEHKNMNLILVIIALVTIGVLAAYGYFHFAHGQIPSLSFLHAGGH